MNFPFVLVRSRTKRQAPLPPTQPHVRQAVPPPLPPPPPPPPPTPPPPPPPSPVRPAEQLNHASIISSTAIADHVLGSPIFDVSSLSSSAVPTVSNGTLQKLAPIIEQLIEQDFGSAMPPANEREDSEQSNVSTVVEMFRKLAIETSAMPANPSRNEVQFRNYRQLDLNETDSFVLDHRHEKTPPAQTIGSQIQPKAPEKSQQGGNDTLVVASQCIRRLLLECAQLENPPSARPLVPYEATSDTGELYEDILSPDTFENVD